MSLITEYTSEIRLYDYSEKSILLVTPPEWGRANAETIKTFGKFGSRFKIEEKYVAGWIIAKRIQSEVDKKVRNMLESGPTRILSSSKREEPLSSSDDSLQFDEEDETPRPSLLRARTLKTKMEDLRVQSDETFLDPFSQVEKMKNLASGGFKFSEKSDKLRTRYFIAGTKQMVDEKIQEVMGQYNPFGYGTYVDYSSEWSDKKIVLISRSNSCD